MLTEIGFFSVSLEVFRNVVRGFRRRRRRGGDDWENVKRFGGKSRFPFFYAADVKFSPFVDAQPSAMRRLSSSRFKKFKRIALFPLLPARAARTSSTKEKMALFEYNLLHQDAQTNARRGEFETTRGVVQLPTFMPVGTRGSVKGVEVGLLEETGSQIVLGNTYHLMLRPGAEIVRELGGLHKFCGWKRPMLTDSGGFQLFSLAQLTKITEEGAVFRSHIDGRKISLTPEGSVAIQEALGSDIAMVFDHVVALPNLRNKVEDAMKRTIRWAARCKEAHSRPDQAQFAIVQGGLEYDLRRRCAEELAEMDFPGYAIGGLSVGEEPQAMYDCLDATTPHMPANKPRYLMGVGRPEDLVEGIMRGVDMFDCVMPSRNGRNAMAFTDFGPMRMRNARYERDDRPLEENCPCPACRRSRAYLRHLFTTGEMLGPILLTIHNITYYQRLMERARRAIENDAYLDFYRKCKEGWNAGVPD